MNDRTQHIQISVPLVRQLSSDSISVMEFKSDLDITIAGKMLQFPSLAQDLPDYWALKFSRELDMSNDSNLFNQKCGDNMVELVQGGMIHQFNSAFTTAKYWINLEQGRKRILGKQRDEGQTLPYQDYRLVHRRIASRTNERSLIACVVPPNCFCADTAQTIKKILPYDVTIFITAIFNSFVADFEMRKRITSHLDMHFMYTLRIPRLTKADRTFNQIVDRAAKLICTTPEFDDLAEEVGLSSHTNGATDPIERAKLRAELDGIIAHLYGLTEFEFAHILNTFPIVPQSTKDAALQAYRDYDRSHIR